MEKSKEELDKEILLVAEKKLEIRGKAGYTSYETLLLQTILIRVQYL